jgi:hypothetical protein
LRNGRYVHALIKKGLRYIEVGWLKRALRQSTYNQDAGRNKGSDTHRVGWDRENENKQDIMN